MGTFIKPNMRDCKFQAFSPFTHPTFSLTTSIPLFLSSKTRVACFNPSTYLYIISIIIFLILLFVFVLPLSLSLS